MRDEEEEDNGSVAVVAVVGTEAEGGVMSSERLTSNWLTP